MRNFERWCLETCHYLLRSVVEEGTSRVVSGEPTIFPPFCPATRAGYLFSCHRQPFNAIVLPQMRLINPTI